MTKLIWTVAFWKKQAEAVIVTFSSVLAGSGAFTGGVPNWNAFLAALISAGVAAGTGLVGAGITASALGGAAAAAGGGAAAAGGGGGALLSLLPILAAL